MKKQTFVSVAFFAFLSAAVSVTVAAPIHFNVKLSSASDVGAPVNGRLIIFVRKDDGKPSDGFGTDFTDPNAVWVTGKEVSDIGLGDIVRADGEEVAFPSPFSSIPDGAYQIFALLDRDHSYTYSGPGPGDLVSDVKKITLPTTQDILIELAPTIPSPKRAYPPNVKLIDFVSPMLSRFWGRPITMKAAVLLPPGYETGKDKYPVIYNITGYGGTRYSRLGQATALAKEMAAGIRPKMINVYLESQVPLGHSVWADSDNNGPWGTALEKEFIPYLEKEFRMDAKPSGRFLTGHSSGGWATLWVMVTHPDFFGGTWSTSPDPVDFRNFTGPDLYKNTNAYTDATGRDYYLVRDHGVNLMSVRQYASQEMVTGYYGGQFSSFNAVFSPKGDDGQPMKIFDVKTGIINKDVFKAWEKYDISKLLRENWKTLGPKLKGKIHIVVGTADTFHLDEAVRLLDAELKKLGSDARIEYIDGRTHFDLYTIDGDREGLLKKFQWEMYKIAKPSAKAKTAAR